MQKQNVAKVIFLSLTLILVLSVIVLFKGEKRDRTKNMYNKICNVNEYTFKIQECKSLENKFIIVKDGKNKSLDLTSSLEHTTTLIKEGYAYFIMHNKEEYYIFESENMNEIEANILEDDLEYIKNAEYSTGKEKIYGKTYYYEEYKDIDSFLMLNISLEEDTKLKTRFYFDGNSISYIKTIIDEENYELLKVEFNLKADENLLEIPNNYAEL